MAAHDNLEEYRDPVLYDLENGGFEIGGRFYADLAQQVGDPILDLACGTGRISVPLAERGFDVTGVDVAPEMLQHAQVKARRQDVSVRWVHADCRSMDLGRRFSAIFLTGNAFQAFLDRQSQEKMLERVRAHLAPGGLFAFETRNPRLASLAEGSDEETEQGSVTDADGREIRVSERRYYDLITQVEHYTICRRYLEPTGEAVVRESRIDLRYVFPAEIESLLHYNGFKLESLYGDFDRAPLAADSPLMVCVCRMCDS